MKEELEKLIEEQETQAKKELKNFPIFKSGNTITTLTKEEKTIYDKLMDMSKEAEDTEKPKRIII